MIGVGVLDTSVLVALAKGEPVQTDALPDEGAVSVVTLSELLVGVLIAKTPAERAVRLEFLYEIRSRYDVTPVDEEVAHKHADLSAAAREQGRKQGTIDLIIAATARALDLPLYTKDKGFDWMPGLEVVQV